MFNRLRSFLYGCTLPFLAAKLIATRPKLLFWSLLPVAVTLSLYGVLLRYLEQTAQLALAQYFISLGWDPQGWSAWILLLLTRILLFLIGAITFSFVSSVVSSPFNDFLAEQTESHSSPKIALAHRVSVSRKIRLIFIDLIKSLAATLAALVTLFVSWIPGVGLVAMVITFLLFTFQYISYPQTRRGVGLGSALLFLWDHFYASLGFGLVLSFLFALPIVSSFAVPLAVVGGTLLFARATQGPRVF